MNREILFRGKRADNGEWVEGSLIQCCSGNKYILLDGDYANEMDEIGAEGYLSFQSFEVDPDTVSQYTERRDSHMEQVFEGDLLRIQILDRNRDNKVIVDDIAAVIYHDGCYGVLWGTRKEFTRLNAFCNCRIEVVGNRWDNPELLKEE